MKVSTKLATGFILVLLIASMVGLLGINGMRNLQVAGERMYEQRIIGLEYVHGVMAAYGQMLLASREVVTDSLYDDRKGALDSQLKFEHSAETFMELMDKSMGMANTEELLLFHERILELVENDYLQRARKINEISINDIPDHYNRLYVNVQVASLTETTDNIDHLLSGLVVLNAAIAEQMNLDNARFMQTYIIGQIALLAAAVFIVIIVAIFIIRSIAVPVNESVAVLKKIAEGDFTARVTGRYKGDFGTMKDSLNDTAAQLTLYMDGMLQAERIAHEAELNKSIVEAEANAALAEEKHKAAVAEEGSKAKTAFLATMSHEIRTPMNAILGITEIHLQDAAIEPKYKEAFDKIYNSSDLLLGIINDLLDMSKIEANKLEIYPVKYETASMLNDIVTINLMRFSSTRLIFKLSIDENTPAALLGDDLRIKQIMNNLLSNAFKYTKEGEVSLSVGFEDKDDDVVELIFRLSDTGRGMTKEQVEKLFDEYSRFDMAANRNTEGTGLGMNITRNLLKLMEGTIDVDSKVGRGTDITVRLPQGRAGYTVLGKELVKNLEQNRSGIASVKRTQIVFEPMPYGKVLIVDDVSMNIYVAKGLMAPYELAIDSAENGKDAIELIRDGSVYDIIFMDYMMPEMDGVEATRIIREMGYANTIIALTADAIAGREDMFLENGFEGFVSKPIDIRLLDITLKKYVRDMHPDEALEVAQSAQKKPAARKKVTRSAVLDALMQIDILDVELGLRRFAGIEKVYVDGVRLFKKRLPQEVEALSAFLAAADAKAFRIAVHGLKSQLATVGAMALVEVAQDLENAAKKADMAYIGTHFSAFEDALMSLRAALLEAFPEEEKAEEPVNLAAPSKDALKLLDELEPLLKVGDTACMSMLGALRTISGTQELVEQMEMIDFDKAYHTLASLREKWSKA